MTTSSPRWLRYALIPVLLLGAGVRLLGLGNENLWGDEAFSVMTALGPIRTLLSSLASGEPHPPLYPALLAIWLRAFGHSEFVARLPSAILGIASIAVTAAIARRFASDDDPAGRDRTALIAALLVALSPFQVWYSQEARMYAQVSFFAGLATLGLLRLWEGRRGGVPLYVVGLLGAMGSHYYGLFIPLAHALATGGALARDRDVWPRARAWLKAAVIAGVLYLPWVVYAQRVFRSYYAAQPGTVNLAQIALQSWVRVSAGWSLGWSHAELASAILTGLILIGLALPSRGPSDGFSRQVVGFWLFTPFVAGFLVSLVRPMYAERYLVVSSLPMILLVARGVSWPWRVRFGALVGSAGLAGALVLGLGPLYNVWQGAYLKSTYDTHVKVASAFFRPGDAVILDGTSQLPLYNYYLPAPWPTFAMPATLPFNATEVTGKLRTIESQYQGVWIFLYATQDYDPGYQIPRWLTANAYRTYDDWAVTGRLQYYRFAPEASLTQREVAIHFGSSLALGQFGLSDAPLAAGDSIPVDLHWQQLATPMNRPRVSLRLIGGDGFIWAQTDQYVGGDFDSPLPWKDGTAFDDHHGLLIPPGTPPGNYRLLLNAYPEGADQSLPATGTGAAIGPSGVLLGTVHVDQPSRTFSPIALPGFQAMSQSFPDGLRLLGFAGGQSGATGSSAYLTLVWQADQSKPTANSVQVLLEGRDGKVVETRNLPFAADFPPSKWAIGDVVRGQYNVPISDHLTPGTYSLRIRPSDVSGEGLALGSFQVEPGAAPAPSPHPQHQLAAQLGDSISLSGYDLGGTSLKPGDKVDLTLYWHDLGDVTTDYKVFVHVLDNSQKVVAQRDQIPADGQRPTSSWFPGDDVADHYQIALPSDLPAGTYPVEIGMYNASSGARLPVTQNGQSAGDRIILTNLEVTQ